MEKQFYSVKDVAEMLNIGKGKAYALMQAKNFPAIKLSGTYKVSTELFNQWVAKTIAEGGEFIIERRDKNK